MIDILLLFTVVFVMGILSLAFITLMWYIQYHVDEGEEYNSFREYLESKPF